MLKFLKTMLFYSHTGIGNWFQCFPVYPGVNVSSGFGSGSGSGFRIPDSCFSIRPFGKPQNIISKHMDEMFKIPGCVNDNASQLRLAYDKISVNIKGLESLGVSSNQYGSLLIPVIMSKLPHEIRVQVARNTALEVWDVSYCVRSYPTGS